VANGTTGWTVPSISLQSGTNVITVQARDAAGNASPDVLTVIYSPPTTGGSGGGSPSSPLQIVSVTTNVPSPQPLGSVITFTAAASGGTGSYEYHWTLFDGVNWNLVQNWTTSPSYTWRPTVASTAYQMTVRVRNRGDASSEVHGPFVRFTITSAPTGGGTGGSGGGTGTGDTRRPQVDITGPSNGTDYTSWSSTLAMSGTASDNVGVTQVTWSNDRGGSGVASGTTNWQASIPLQRGDNVITITARDAAGNVATDVQNVLRP
jgi:hypothetical protein